MADENTLKTSYIADNEDAIDNEDEISSFFPCGATRIGVNTSLSVLDDAYITANLLRPDVGLVHYLRNDHVIFLLFDSAREMSTVETDEWSAFVTTAPDQPAAEYPGPVPLDEDGLRALPPCTCMSPTTQCQVFVEGEVFLAYWPCAPDDQLGGPMPEDMGGGHRCFVLDPERCEFPRCTSEGQVNCLFEPFGPGLPTAVDYPPSQNRRRMTTASPRTTKTSSKTLGKRPKISPRRTR